MTDTGSNTNCGLKGRRILVIGGSRGIRLELARKLVTQKARVAVCARKCIVHPLFFLASLGTDFITGQVLLIDGGASAT